MCESGDCTHHSQPELQSWSEQAVGESKPCKCYIAYDDDNAFDGQKADDDKVAYNGDEEYDVNGAMIGDDADNGAAADDGVDVET